MFEEPRFLDVDVSTDIRIQRLLGPYASDRFFNQCDCARVHPVAFRCDIFEEPFEFVCYWLFTNAITPSSGSPASYF